MTKDLSAKIAHTAQIVVASAACVADPSGLTLAAAGSTSALSLSEIFKRNPDTQNALAKPMAKALKKSLTTPTFHMPENGPVLLPQMLDGARLTPDDLTGCGLDPDLILGRLLNRHVDPEHRSGEMAEAFCNWLRPPLTGLLGDQEFIETLAPNIWTTALGDLRHIREVTDEIAKQVQINAQQLDHLATLPRDTLELLASQFEIQTPHNLSDAELQDMLSKKAEEYRSFRALINRLDDRVAAIANLKGAAQDAAERLDFETVEELLSRVDTVETEIAANTKQTRAANALLRGKVQQAYDILTAAADSFASVDPLEPSRRRETYAKMLYDYGLRFAGDAMMLAVQMCSKALADVDRAKDAGIWAILQNNLGNALATLGQRESGTEQLEQAVVAYRDALKERTREKVPLDWAATQNNLGNVLRTLGQRESGTERLELAVATYRDALKEWTREIVPLDWAMTQNNLGNALTTIGQRESGTERLDQAVAACQEALKERTREMVPLQWAATQNNLGNALLTLGERESGTERLELAVAAYRDVLKERTREIVPLDWAGTQNNLGNALQTLGERESGTERLELAVTTYRDALKERTREKVPLQWAATQNNLGSALATFGQRESGTERLDQAVAACQEALKERTREMVPLQWAATQHNLGGIYLAYFDKTNDIAHLDKAEAHVRAALKVFEVSAPHYAGMAQGLLQQIAARRDGL